MFIEAKDLHCRLIRACAFLFIIAPVLLNIRHCLCFMFNSFLSFTSFHLTSYFPRFFLYISHLPCLNHLFPSFFYIPSAFLPYFLRFFSVSPLILSLFLILLYALLSIHILYINRDILHHCKLLCFRRKMRCSPYEHKNEKKKVSSWQQKQKVCFRCTK